LGRRNGSSGLSPLEPVLVARDRAGTIDRSCNVGDSRSWVNARVCLAGMHRVRGTELPDPERNARGRAA
jgi:hypothetical protein